MHPSFLLAGRLKDFRVEELYCDVVLRTSLITHLDSVLGTETTILGMERDVLG